MLLSVGQHSLLQIDMKRSIKPTVSFRLTTSISLVAFGLIALTSAAQNANRSATEQATLNTILVSNSLSWKFSQPGRIESLDGRMVLCSGGQPLTLSGSELFPVDTEYRLAFRLMPT